MIHELKTRSEYFKETFNKNKMFECRYDDRDFQVGDIVILKEWDEGMGYSGREIRGEITYILDKFAGLNEGWVVLSIKIKSIEKISTSKSVPLVFHGLTPIIEASGYADGCLAYETWHCPNCDEAYEFGNKYSYCPKCGQSLWWDGLRLARGEAEKK